jgi:hypothetical protein
MAFQNLTVENIIVGELSPYCAIYCFETNELFSFQLEKGCLLGVVVID